MIEGLGDTFDVCVDLGTGSTALMEALSKKCKIVIGIDINPCVADICKKLKRQCVICDSCIRKADLVVSNLPYLPCDDKDWLGLATCDINAIKMLEGIRSMRPKTIILVYSSLSRFDPLEYMKGYVVVKRKSVKGDFEEIIALLLRDKSLLSPQTPQ